MAIWKFFEEIRTMARFGFVGLGATGLHGLVLIGLVDFLSLSVLIANALAFAIAFIVSYLGHKNWSFGASSQHHHKALKRFALIALVSFLVNHGLLWGVLTMSLLNYKLAVLISLSVAAATSYSLSRFWAFHKNPASTKH